VAGLILRPAEEAVAPPPMLQLEKDATIEALERQ
jgi:hypothetical protein